MKKYISYILMLPVLLLSFSCNKEKEPVATMTGIYYAGVDGAEDVIEVSPGKSKTILVRAYADEGKVSDLPVNISFKADPEAVAAYNAAKGTSYVMCPGSCFEFATPEVLMPRYGRASSSAKVRVTGSGMEEGITYLLPLTIDKVTGTDKWELTEAPHA